MKKTVNFRFSEDVLSKLERLAEGSTRTAVLERLVEQEFERRVPASTVIQAPDPEVAKRLVAKTSREPEAVDTPEQAREYAKSVGRSATVQPVRRRINPMTGKPFGAVPK